MNRIIAASAIFIIASAAVLLPVQAGSGQANVVFADNAPTSPAQTQTQSPQVTQAYNACIFRGGSQDECNKIAGVVSAGDTTYNNCITAGGTASSCDSQGTAAQNKAAGFKPGTSNTCTSFATCVADLVYLVTVSPTSEFAYIGSMFLSVGIHLSLQSTAYALTFLQTGWGVARDVANMAFLFAIVYLAITIIVSANSAGTTHTLVLIIVMALLVNFSFFLTRVVVDGGNILAVTVYNAIPITTTVDSEGASSATTGAGSTATTGSGCSEQSGANFICGTGTKDLSSAIMAGLNVQNLYNTDQFQKWAAANDSLTKILTLVTLYIALAIILAFIGFIFLSVGAKFLVRIVALWLVIIVSPIAFAAYALPQTRRYFSQWIWQLLKNSFYPVVFLFLFLFVVLFMQQGCPAGSNQQCLGLLSNVFTVNTTSANASYAATLGLDIAAVAIVMGLVIILLYIAMKVSDRAAGAGANIVRNAPGFLIGRSAALGGFAGRWSVGLAGAAAARSDTLRDSGRVGRTLWRMGGRAAASSFNPLATRLGGTVGNRIGAGRAGGQGGVEATLQRRGDRLVRRGTALLDTDAQKEKRLEAYNEQFARENNMSFDEAVARQKGIENQAGKDIDVIRDQITKLQVKRQASQNGKLNDIDAAELRRLEDQRRQKNDQIRAAQKQQSDWMKERTQGVERPDENRARLEEFMQKGPVLGQNVPGTHEALGKLRTLLPEMAPVKPSREEMAAFGEAAAAPARVAPAAAAPGIAVPVGSGPASSRIAAAVGATGASVGSAAGGAIRSVTSTMPTGATIVDPTISKRIEAATAGAESAEEALQKLIRLMPKLTTSLDTLERAEADRLRIIAETDERYKNHEAVQLARRAVGLSRDYKAIAQQAPVEESRRPIPTTGARRSNTGYAARVAAQNEPPAAAPSAAPAALDNNRASTPEEAAVRKNLDSAVHRVRQMLEKPNTAANDNDPGRNLPDAAE